MDEARAAASIKVENPAAFASAKIDLLGLIPVIFDWPVNTKRDGNSVAFELCFPMIFYRLA